MTASAPIVSPEIPQIFPPELPCLVGVSGGPDSVALLHLLLKAGYQNLTVCHFDHSLRSDSHDDAQFVADLAENLRLPCVSTRQDVATLATQSAQSIETAARHARYQFFAEVAHSRNCPRLFLAHHADDQAETILFHLFRGSGSTGLAGIRRLAERSINGLTLQIARPLLHLWKTQILAFLHHQSILFRTDPTNLDLRHSRNRLRHEIIPTIEKLLGREIRQSLWQAAEILRDEDDFLQSQPELQNPPTRLSTSTLRTLPTAIQRRLIHAWLQSQATTNIGFQEVEGVRSLLSLPSAKINLPGGIHARRRAKEIFLEWPDQKPL
ncbi:MAG: tRNA lysidine(34) synthetase TilS [Verrucomicrobia bacterium]|nr:tRNA lysidine(34) synthetase TilS [Verrucomicrobiota bacterium]